MVSSAAWSKPLLGGVNSQISYSPSKAALSSPLPPARLCPPADGWNLQSGEQKWPTPPRPPFAAWSIQLNCHRFPQPFVQQAGCCCQIGLRLNSGLRIFCDYTSSDPTIPLSSFSGNSKWDGILTLSLCYKLTLVNHRIILVVLWNLDGCPASSAPLSSTFQSSAIHHACSLCV